MDTNRSWSIDDKRLNFQFGCEIGWEIKNGKRGRMLSNPTYTGIGPRFWGAWTCSATSREWTFWGTPNCGKGQPSRSATPATRRCRPVPRRAGGGDGMTRPAARRLRARARPWSAPGAEAEVTVRPGPRPSPGSRPASSTRTWPTRPSAVHLRVALDGGSPSRPATRPMTTALDRLVRSATGRRPPPAGGPGWPGLAPAGAGAGGRPLGRGDGRRRAGRRARDRVGAFVAGRRPRDGRLLLDDRRAGRVRQHGRPAAVGADEQRHPRRRRAHGHLGRVRARGRPCGSPTSTAAPSAREAARRRASRPTRPTSSPATTRWCSSPTRRRHAGFLALHGFNGQRGRGGPSFARLGEAQFDAVDHPRRRRRRTAWRSASAFDAEGTPKRRVDLVRDGVTTGLVHDRRTAQGARAPSRPATPSPARARSGAMPANLVLGPGTASRTSWSLRSSGACSSPTSGTPASSTRGPRW